MTAAEKLYELIPTLTEPQLHSVLDFAKSLQHSHTDLGVDTKPTVSTGHLVDLLGIAKTTEPAPTDEELREDYTNYLIEKYK